MKRILYSVLAIIISVSMFEIAVSASQHEVTRAYAYQMPVYAECTGPYISKKVFGYFTTNTPLTGSFYIYEYDEIEEKPFFSVTYTLANGGVFNPFRSNSYSYAFTETYPVGTETCPSLLK